MYKEVDVSNKKHARIRIWAFACEWHQPPDPHLISESYFSLFFCGTTPSGQFVVGLVPATPVFWPGEFHALHSPWGCRVGHDSNFHFHFNTSTQKKEKMRKAWERKKIGILGKINNLYTWKHIEVKKESCIKQITSFVWPECQDVRLENYTVLLDFPGGSDRKESAYSVGDLGLISGLGRSPGEGHGNPLQYSCLENPMDGGACWAKVHGVAKSRTRLNDFTCYLKGSKEFGLYSRTELKDQWVHLLDDIAVFPGTAGSLSSG